MPAIVSEGRAAAKKGGENNQNPQSNTTHPSLSPSFHRHSQHSHAVFAAIVYSAFQRCGIHINTHTFTLCDKQYAATLATVTGSPRHTLPTSTAIIFTSAGSQWHAMDVGSARWCGRGTGGQEMACKDGLPWGSTTCRRGQVNVDQGHFLLCVVFHP